MYIPLAAGPSSCVRLRWFIPNKQTDPQERAQTHKASSDYSLHSPHARTLHTERGIRPATVMQANQRYAARTVKTRWVFSAELQGLVCLRFWRHRAGEAIYARILSHKWLHSQAVVGVKQIRVTVSPVSNLESNNGGQIVAFSHFIAGIQFSRSILHSLNFKIQRVQGGGKKFLLLTLFVRSRVYNVGLCPRR